MRNKEHYHNVMRTLHNQSKEPTLYLQWIAIATPNNLISCRHWVLSKQTSFKLQQMDLETKNNIEEENVEMQRKYEKQKQ
jgi:hypothetical protein